MPNPAGFIAQKLLIRNSRKPDKRAQDTLYIHDTVELFGADLEELRGIWQERIEPGLSKSAVRTLQRVRVEQFGSVTDVLREAAAIPQDRRIEPKDIQALCELGLAEISGGT